MSETNDSEIRKERKKGTDEEWKQDPKSKYLKAREGSITEADFNREKYRIERFDVFIQQHEDIPDEVGLRDVVLEDVYEYLNKNLVPDESLSDRTIEEHLNELNYFYKTLRAHKVLDGNPVYRPDREEGDRGALAEVRESDDFSVSTNAKRPYIPMDRMQKFLGWLDSPRERGFHLVGLKTAARSGSVNNIDLRCVHIAHPIYYQVLDDLGITLDERVNNKPDSILLYEGFNRGTEIPNEARPGPDEGEVRAAPSKRSEQKGSVIPIDSELKTALLEWAMVRPPTPEKDIHPLFTKDGLHGRRLDYESFNSYWCQDKKDSVRRFGKEESLEKCPDCQGEVVEKNPKQIAPGRHYDCRDCGERHWRSIMWEGGLESPQKFVFHCHRNYFSDAHRVGKSDITDDVMDEPVRKHKVRGDAYSDMDADQRHYDNPENLDWEKDVREPYLHTIYKFNLYDNPVPAVGEGWEP